MKFEAQQIALLGVGSYPSILFESIAKMDGANAQTIEGQELLEKTLTKTSKSLTPLLELHSFVTNAQTISGNDKTIGDVCDFLSKQFKGGDLNYLINLAKEQHIQTVAKNGFPFPAETLGKIKDLFGKPSKVIEQLINDGLFETLEGDIYTEIKSVVGLKDSNNKVSKNAGADMSKIKTLNENHNLATYTPIGITFQDINDNTILLFENTSVVIKDEKLSTTVLDSIPNKEARLMGALISLDKNYKDDSFGLAERWDINVRVDKQGNAILTEQPKAIGIQPKAIKIANGDLKGLLSDTINYYETLIVKPKGYDKEKYQLDADNLIQIFENHSRLVKMDGYTSLRNLIDNSFVTYQNDTTKAPLVVANSGVETFVVESYNQLNNFIQQTINQNIGDVFQEQISNEQKFVENRYQDIYLLDEDAKEIDTLLKEVKQLKQISAEGSEALEILTQQETDLTARLQVNLEKQSFCRFKQKMY